MNEPASAGPENDPSHHELRPYQLFMFGLGVFVLLSLAAQSFLKLSESTNAILDQVDQIVCVVFFVDFWINLYTAHDRLAYLKWGWIDLLSSIPMIDMARAGRVARIIRILRAFRGVRSARFLADYLLHRRADGAFFAVALLSVLLVLFSSISILQFETAAESNIRTPQDALWWAFATITTVGYGDKYPVTTEGRMIAAVLMTAGVGMFGSFTGLIASWILSPSKKDREQDSELTKLREQVSAIQEHLAVHRPTLNAPAEEHDLIRVRAAWPSLPVHVKAKILRELDGTPGRRAA
ncbi:MAG: potassium channel family protein [Planctomycetia bacterium]|nr:potassium channel family protein [Planctomycetia bacterium]